MATQANVQTQSQSQNQVSLKLVIDKKGKRIRQELYRLPLHHTLSLFTTLSLPLGAVAKLLPMETWPLGNVYRSMETLNINYFEPNNNIDTLLNPKLPSTTQSHFKSLLQIQSYSPPTTYYTCSTYNNTTSCRYKWCSMPQMLEIHDHFEHGGYVKGGLVTYMVMDDLTVKPISSSMSTISVLNQLRVEDVAQIEEKLVYLDINEVVKLLKASLQLHTTTVLTDMFLHKINFSSTPGRNRKIKVYLKREDN